jgi:hypothetical protein
MPLFAAFKDRAKFNRRYAAKTQPVPQPVDARLLRENFSMPLVFSENHPLSVVYGKWRDLRSIQVGVTDDSLPLPGADRFSLKD